MTATGPALEQQSQRSNTQLTDGVRGLRGVTLSHRIGLPQIISC